MRAALAVLVLAVACSGDDATPAVDAPAEVDAAPIDTAPPIDAVEVDAPPAAFTLASTAIAGGGVIPDLYSCQGTNVSPPLAWSNPPVTPGYALVFTDMSNGLVHSILYDIPSATAALPENVEKVYQPPVPAGSKQPLAYDNQTRGYLGPCPGATHTYQFALVAVDANPLPGLTMASTRTQVRAAIVQHTVATATLTATFTP